MEPETVNLETGEIMASPVRRSSSIAKLVEALAKASTEFLEVAKDTENPFYKKNYADLASLIKSTRPFLGKNGLVVSQFPLMAGTRAGATTILAHTSGEWMESDLTLPVSKADAQGAGSAITYARRYAYQSVLNVAGEEDDDGNAATGKTKKQVIETIQAHEDAFDQRVEGEQTISNAFQEGIRALAKQYGRTDEQLISWMKVNCGVERIDKVLKRDVEKFKLFVMGKEPLEQTLESSAKAIASPATRPTATPGTKISEAQLKRLHAIRNAKGVSEPDVKQYVKELGGPEHLAELNRTMYNVVCGWIESVQP
jgi:ERF superfamily